MASNSSASGTSDKSRYVYNLPYIERKKLCNILDLDDFWEDLGGTYLGFDVDTLSHFRHAVVRHSSPTDEMLRAWGIQNHTVLELFILLSKMHHYQAMMVLKPFVPPNYHRLIDEGEENPLKHLNNGTHESKRKDSDSSNVDKSMLFGVHNLDLDGKLAKPGPSDKDKKIINTPDNEAAASSNCDKLDPLKVALEGHLPMIPYAELEKATGGWDGRNLLGKGGFGMVYKGMWKHTDVAIKRLEVQPCRAEDKNDFQNQLLTELRSLNTFRHDNILPLYGFSVGGSYDCLIYQYMPNGSLEDKLLCRDRTWPLSWANRHFIAIGVARGLQFLHNFGEKPLVHGDIKCANILLDPSLVPKIGDFGLAREGPVENYTYIKVSRVHGTKPYLPDEFIRDRKFSTKVDVYSFGIVLFELASGLRAYDDKRKYKLLKDHVESVSDDNILVLSDPKIPPDPLTFHTLILIGKKSTSIKPKNRPEMVDILKDLEMMLCSGDRNRGMLYVNTNSARPSGQSDLPMTRDGQVTASAQPCHPKSLSPVFLLNPEQASKPKQGSILDSYSTDGSESGLYTSRSNAPNGNPFVFENPAPQPSNGHVPVLSSSDSSAIPAISMLLPNRN